MLGLTRQERQIILFLMITSFIGIGISFIAKAFPPFAAASIEFQDIAKINLNRADKNLFMAVPGIKEKLAQRIIDYRKEKGSFRDVEELKQIKGISEAKYEKIKNSFCVR